MDQYINWKEGHWGFQSGSGPSLRSRLFLNPVDCAVWARCVCVAV
jgi:hypothetical protein